MAAAAFSRFGQHDIEFVAADPGKRVSGAQFGAEPVADFHQQRIPGAVAEAIVDLLEPIDIHVEEREPLFRSRDSMTAVSRRSFSMTRLGSPVRLSWWAW